MKGAEEKKREILNRLSRLEGQVRGVRKMIENEQDCEKVVTQLSALHAALEGVTKLMVAGFFHECIHESQEKGESQEKAMDRFVSLLLNTRM